MRMNTLGKTDISVTELCLGTMTFGTQTDEAEAHAQIDFALEAGLNFMDCAEMYPVNPVTKETAGDSEVILGNWFEKTGKRKDWVLATKISGIGNVGYRDGAPITAPAIREAIEGSLARMKTDYIDLYQLHWPNRGTYAFRRNWGYDPSQQPSKQEILDNMAEVLEALDAEVKRGTLRAIGLSNETAWGTRMWCELAEKTGLPRMATIQNEYSLLYRMADTDLAETMIHEEVGLLPYSPLATGLLTGKYQNGVVPKGSRMDINGDLGGRKSDRAFEAVAGYAKVAEDFGLDLVHMALAWSARKPFIASSIFGATTVDQLKHLMGAVDVEITDELSAALDAVHKAHPMPY